MRIQLIIRFLGQFKGSLGKTQKVAALEGELGFLKVYLQFLEFYLV